MSMEGCTLDALPTARWEKMKDGGDHVRGRPDATSAVSSMRSGRLGTMPTMGVALARMKTGDRGQRVGYKQEGMSTRLADVFGQMSLEKMMRWKVT